MGKFNRHTIFSRLLASAFPIFAYLPPDEFKKFMMFFDAIVVAAFFLIGSYLTYDLANPYCYPLSMYAVFLPLFVIMWMSLLYFLGMYRTFKTKQISEILFIIVKAVIIGAVFWSIFMYVFEMHYVRKVFIIFTYSLTTISLTVEKLMLMFFLRYQDKKGISYRRILVVGTGERACSFIDKINKNPEWGIKVVGIIDENEKVSSTIKDTKIIGSLNNIAKIIEETVVDEVVFILPRRWLTMLEEYILICEKVGVKASIAADLFTPSVTKLRVKELYDMPFLIVDTMPYNVWHLFIKRTLDVLGSFSMLLLSFPFLLISAILIKLTSHGPVIFKQKRLGLNGRIFTLYKLRTMVVGAEHMLNKIKDVTETDGPVFHSRRDPRVTPIGRFLRMTSLDELPQLFNVLIGEMSFIGPRPPLPEEAKQYERWQRRRLSLRPGIVCTWQVTKRFQPGFAEWVKMDLDYIDNWSLMLDFKILLKTLPAILKGWRYWSSKKS